MNTNSQFIQDFKNDGYFQYPINFEQIKKNNKKIISYDQQSGYFRR